MPLNVAASRAGGRGAACTKLRAAVAAALLQAAACSRAPEQSPGAAPPNVGGGASPSIAPADAHLARAEEARDREEYDLARREAESARAIFEKEGDVEGSVRAGNLAGGMLARQGDHKAALERLNAVLATAQVKLGVAHPEVARSYFEIARISVHTGRPKEGLELFEKALALRRGAGNGRTKEVAEILVSMGSAHSDLGEDEQALALLEEAEAISRSLPDQPRLATALIAKGAALWGRARYDPAVEALEEAVRFLEAEDPRRNGTLAAAYINLGNAYWSKGDHDEALAYYENALARQIVARGEKHPYVAIVHYNLATLHLVKREYDACIASAERALAILVPALGERHDVVVQSYSTIGFAYTKKKDAERGLTALRKALALQLSLPETGGRDTAVIYWGLAEAYQAKGDRARALHNARQALTVNLSIYGPRHPDVAEAYATLAERYLDWGDGGNALRLFGKAISANTSQAVGAEPDLDPPLDAAFSGYVLLGILKNAAKARLMARPGGRPELEAAARVYEHASRLIDRMRASYRAEGSKLQMAARASETYDEAIRAELELFRLTGDERRLERAFGYAEKAKAGVLRDALNEAKARSFARIPPPVLEGERKLRVDLASADHQLTQAQLEGGAEDESLQALRDQRFALSREYQALQQKLEKEYPAYYDLKYRFDTASSPEIREQLLDARTALVEYFLGKQEIFIFTITQQGLEATRVAREASLEADLQELGRAISGHDLASYARRAHRLYSQLLAPVEGRLAGKDLVVVPDPMLSTLPFEALLTREVGPEVADASKLPYVLRDHAVSYAYSATILLQGVRQTREDPPDELVAFAPFVAEGSASTTGPRPLPASRQEVLAVRGLVAKRQGLLGGWFSHRSRVYLGRDATEGRLKSSALERYRYVHLATHGIADAEHPGLSRLLLTPAPGSEEDGVVHLGEIYNLHLAADLVVLSACDTGLGRFAPGEGIIGLARGFLYAGARSLLVSLWPVSDAAASMLVADFYDELLAGNPKAQALREAKLRAMGRNPEYAKPYYWSSLVLVGEGRCRTCEPRRRE